MDSRLDKLMVTMLILLNLITVSMRRRERLMINDKANESQWSKTIK